MTKKKKRQDPGEPDPLEALTRQMQKNGLYPKGQVVLTNMEGPKISAVLLDFIEPYKKDARTRDAYEKLIMIAVIAWNAAILDGKERQNLIDVAVKAIARSAGEEWGKGAANIIAMLIRRKERLFADDKRYIADYRLSETATDYHLSVAAILKR